MKLTVYLRVAQGARGPRVSASAVPNYEPFYSSGYHKTPLPTAAFALRLDVPDEAFHAAERVLAEIEVAENEVAVAADVKPRVEEA